jgi:hypothetical protein
VSTYPGTLDGFTGKTDSVDDVLAADVNELQSAISAIETELGVDPAGSVADVVTRLSRSLDGAGMLDFLTPEDLTVTSGAVAVGRNYSTLDTEGGAGTDDLETITGGAVGFVVVFRLKDATHHVVFKHGTGNISCATANDITLAEAYQWVIGIYDDTLSKWLVASAGAVGIPKTHKELRIDSIRAKTGAAAPTSTTRAVGASGGILMPVLSFSKTTQQDCYFEFLSPFDLDATGAINFHLVWQPGAAWTTGNYLWNLEYLVKDESGATLLAGTPTTLTANVTPADAVKDIETVFTGDITMAADQRLLCHFYRDVADNADDTGEVAFFEFEYTSDILGEAIA